MIKHVANEPSVGLYFVQQHAHASMPILLDVKEIRLSKIGFWCMLDYSQFILGYGIGPFCFLHQGKVAEKTREVTLHTEDIEDSICAVRSMAEFGLPIADDMIKDINRSLMMMSKTQPKRGLIQNPTWGFQSGKTSEAWEDVGATNGGSSRNYLSSMFNTAKQKASILRWPQPDFSANDDVSEKSGSSAAPGSSKAGRHGASTPSDAERDDLPVSSRLLGNNNAGTTNPSLSASDISHMAESYNKFKEEQELKLQEWLRESKEAEDNRDS
uniref:Uncharacterized protein n=1 Tax=Brachypodium distachyon TaxID=15368 RepID=C3SAE6_BRADI|nr:hypothetical protein-3 [Brachypodium distachyon]